MATAKANRKRLAIQAQEVAQLLTGHVKIFYTADTGFYCSDKIRPSFGVEFMCMMRNLLGCRFHNIYTAVLAPSAFLFVFTGTGVVFIQRIKK